MRSPVTRDRVKRDRELQFACHRQELGRCRSQTLVDAEPQAGEYSGAAIGVLYTDELIGPADLPPVGLGRTGDMDDASAGVAVRVERGIGVFGGGGVVAEVDDSRNARIERTDQGDQDAGIEI